MKHLYIKLLLALMMAAGMAGQAQAKWWIFGKSSTGIQIQYMYINKLSFDGSVDPNLTFFRDHLTDNTLTIKGKASVHGGTIGAVKVTIDNKETWHKAKLSKNGSFSFSFETQINRPYDVFVKIIDTTGKTNDVDATHKIVTVSDKNVEGLIRTALKKLMTAYQAQDPTEFMSLVSPGFEPDAAIMDTAVRKDFDAFDLIQVDYMINNIVAGSRDRIFVSINFNRFVVANQSGDTFRDSHLTEFAFSMGKDRPMLVRAKNPLVFGLSDASNVATGTANQGSNDPLLLVDEYGGVSQKPFKDAIEDIETGTVSSGSGDVVSGTFTVVAGNNTVEGYIFFFDTFIPNELSAPGGSLVKDLSAADIDTITTASVPPGSHDFIMLMPGESAAVKFSDGKYMLLQHVTGTGAGSTMKYRFQPDGTPNF